LAPNHSAATAAPTNAGLTRHRFRLDSGLALRVLIDWDMSLATADLPADPDALRAFALACQAELKAAELSVQLRTLEIEKLKFQIAKLRRMQFGQSSERITRQIEQFELRLEELETGEAEDIAKADAEDRPAPTRESTRPIARAPGPGASRCRTISRGRRSFTSRSMMAPASVPTAVAAWPGSART